MTRLIHRGHIQAAALIVTAKRESALHADVLALLLPGDRVHAVGASLHSHATFRLLILFATARRLEVALSQGTPLHLDGRLMTSFPLSKGEREQAIGAQAQLVLANQGEVDFARIGEAIDPSRWLDLSAFRALKMRSLGAPPPSMSMALTTRDPRAVLGLAPLSGDALAAMKALLAAPAATLTSSTLLNGAVRALAALIRLTQGLFGATKPAPVRAEGQASASQAAPYEPPWIVRKLASWIDALRMRAWQSSLGSYLAKKHAEYIARLMELLERGDIDEALRHAIPLSATVDTGAARAPSLHLPSPRTYLSISKTRTTGGSLGLGDSLFAMLKARYRALYERLIALGRIDDAAFVLAELLDDVLGAVALLEKCGRTREAAELAEARKLEPAILVRQWIIARDLPRALLLARRHGAFEAAITHLRNEPEARKTLAIAWADVRAESGDYLGALLSLEMGGALPVNAPPSTGRGEVRVACVGVTATGKRRSHNEDSFFVSTRVSETSAAFASGLLCAVIDGSGGVRGARPAEVALRCLREADVSTGALTQLVRHLTDTGQRASNEITKGLSATWTVAAIGEAQLLLQQLGDTRGYLLRGSRLEQITPEHSLVVEMLRSGQLKQADVETFPHKNVVTRVLGGVYKPEFVQVELMQRDRLLLCSDGLWRDVPDETIRNALLGDSREALRVLREFAEVEGKDNITLVITDFDGPGLKPFDASVPIAARPFVDHEEGEPSLRPLALRWAELAHDAGGVNGSAALVFRARLMGSIDPETERHARALLLCAGPESLSLRVAFANELAQRSEPFLAPLARLALRTATRDRALYEQPTAAILEKLETLGGEGVLRVDRPAIHAHPIKPRRVPEVFSMGPRGALSIRDAALLPNGQWLVALGEAGVRILKRDGSTLVAFEAPASRLVIADSGTRALALSLRGELTVVHRIDTVQQRVGDPFEVAAMSSHASSFDGERWAVVLDGAGHVLDILQEQPRSLFRVEQCQRVDRSLGCISFEVRGSPPERLRYDEKNILLRVRQALPERFHATVNPTPFHVVYEPVIALLQVDGPDLHLTIGAAPHPTPRSFRGWSLRAYEGTTLSVGKTHAAINVSEGAALTAIGPYTPFLLHGDGDTRTHLARPTGKHDAPPVFIESSARPDEALRIDEELRAFEFLRAIIHPNVIRIQDVGKDQSLQYLVSEYVAGKDLGAIQRALHAQKMPIPWPLAVCVAKQLCDGLETCHRSVDTRGQPLNFVHRALSPSRCMVAFDGTVKVQIAKVLVPDERVRIRTRMGYLSPEQIRGLPVDPRSDLFNLGTILYELLAGRRLFHANTDFEILEAIRTTVIPPLASVAPHIPPALAAIVHQALAREPNARWQSAAEMREALSTIEVDAGISSQEALASWMHATFADDEHADEQRLRRHAPNEAGIVLIHTALGDVQARIVCSKRTGHRMLAQGENETLVCFDDEGRLLALDVHSGRMLSSTSLR